MKVFLVFILMISSISLKAQKIEGTVKDSQGNNLPFASILIQGTPKGVTTNNQGVYSISLGPGNYTVECRYVGYATIQKNVTLDEKDTVLNFQLSPQSLTLKEVVVKNTGEDPAYEIIRQAIQKRNFYDNQVTEFEAQVYTKGILKLRELPDKIMGQVIPKSDKTGMGLDSSGRGILYLSESITKVFLQEPDKLKLEVVSSRVSGSNGLGFDFPIFISFYKNNVNVLGNQINPRGFVSPIADGAFNFYSYKYLGNFFEGETLVNSIRVTPKRQYEPLFSGIINITEGDWRIFSCDLLLTQKSQMEILDSLRISQIHIPVEKDIWRIKNQVLHFDFNQFQIKADGDFVNIYSEYNLEPEFDKKTFDRIVIKYDSAANKKTKEYWDALRPIPLEPEEIKDYRVKDSLLKVRLENPNRNLDSLRKNQGPVKVGEFIWGGINRVHFDSLGDYNIKFDALLKTLQYNTVEGVVLNPSLVISRLFKQLDTRVSFIADARYGFNNRHFNPWAGFTFNSNDEFDLSKKPKRKSFFIAGGKRVSQFFKESDIDGLGNSLGTLLYGRNEMKIYENYFAKAGYSKQWESSARLLIQAGFEDRLPIDNTSDFILNKKWRHRFTPNYPVEVMSSQFNRHQSVAIHISYSITPGQRYIQFPESKMAIGSKYPKFTLEYTKGFKNILGSDVDYDKWNFNVKDDINLKLGGTIKYNTSIGGFLNDRSAFVQDYKHFYNNISIIAAEYVKSFENVPHYRNSSSAPFYAEIHLEHHANGLLTNKIPLIKRWNWRLVEGINGLFVGPNRKYLEVFVGLENIFKLFRVDVVTGLEPGFKPTYAIRIGFGGLAGDPLNKFRFTRTKKIIDVW
ncbi:MAG: DUF5686 and carboxypeptidase regulatory-like domain-containing protein [Ginsengibacter sp.]